MSAAAGRPRPREAFAALLVVALLSATAGALAESATLEIEVLPIERFRIGSDESRFGPLEFVGGFEMRSTDPRFGQLSAMRFLTPGGRFIGVADHGHWFSGTIERDAGGTPIGVAHFSMQPIMGDEGPLEDKHYADAEGLSVHGGIATVSFERDHRVLEFAIDADLIGPSIGELEFLIPRHELRYNRGIETIARAPDDSYLAGARIVVSERSLDPEGNLFAAIIEGPQRGGFFISRSGGFDVTDGVFLPNGDLVLLERRFSPLTGGAMRLRGIAGDGILAGVLVDGEVLMEADMTYQIDNMEALDAWERWDGATILSLMSDDNQSYLQRSLYLEFRLWQE